MKIARMLAEEVREWVEALVMALPGRSGRFLRYLYLRARLGAVSGLCSIGRHAEIGCPENVRIGVNLSAGDGFVLRACGEASVKIGDRFGANGNVRIIADCGGEIVIGSGVMVGPNVVIRASNHRAVRVEVPIWEQGQTGGRVAIGDDVWIGANVVIVANVTIGSHVIVAAGAVVTHDVPDFAIVAGVPARVIADRRERADSLASRDAGS